MVSRYQAAGGPQGALIGQTLGNLRQGELGAYNHQQGDKISCAFHVFPPKIFKKWSVTKHKK